MVKSDFVSVSLPLAMIRRVDEFLKTNDAKKMGVSSRAELLKILMREFFDKQER